MLNYAASEHRSISFARRVLSVTGVALALGIYATTAQALPGIDLSSPLPPVAEGECPRLIQIKYPFLSCANGEIGQSDADENWENSRRMPLQSDWNEGDAVWGPSPNDN